MPVQYTTTYTALAVSVSAGQLRDAMASVPLDDGLESAAGLELVSDITSTTGFNGVQRQIVYANVGREIADPEIAQLLANLYTGVLTQALATPVVASPVTHT